MNELQEKVIKLMENIEDIKDICGELAYIVCESYQFLLELDAAGTMNQEELNELIERIEEVME